MEAPFSKFCGHYLMDGAGVIAVNLPSEWPGLARGVELQSRIQDGKSLFNLTGWGLTDYAGFWVYWLCLTLGCPGMVWEELSLGSCVPHPLCPAPWSHYISLGCSWHCPVPTWLAADAYGLRWGSWLLHGFLSLGSVMLDLTPWTSLQSRLFSLNKWKTRLRWIQPLSTSCKCF